MSDTDTREFFLWTLFQQLMRRGFALGLNEYGSVMQALRAGFGWASRDELRELLCALWATSREEVAVVRVLFDQYLVAEWDLATAAPVTDSTMPVPVETPAVDVPVTEEAAPAQDPGNPSPLAPRSPALTQTSRMPPLRMESLPQLPHSHIFLPQYPVSYRDVAQAWRRLRWSLRQGPPVELDVDATVARRAKLGVVTAPVLRPRRRNQANLLLLIDRKGSMAPFHAYVDEVCAAITQSGGLGRVGTYYFHDSPLEGVDLEILNSLQDSPFTQLDRAVAWIPTLRSGVLFHDRDLLQPYPAERILAEWDGDTPIVIMSDAGAARGHLEPARFVDTIGSLKGLLTLSNRVAWLNPLPVSSWRRSTAAHIARHIPMFPMDRDGMHRAINVLRGQPWAVELPLQSGRHPTRSPAQPAILA